MNKYFVFVIVFISFLSCNNDYDIIVQKDNGVIYKYRCLHGKDTANSTRYRFYNTYLVSQSTFISGKLDGSVIDYYPDGLINIVTNYRNGKAHGVNKVFNEYGTLIRRSLYIQNKQVLFESTMENSQHESLRRKKLIAFVYNQTKWAGEKYTVLNDSSLSMGSYQGMYVEVMVDDTIPSKTIIEIDLDITFPTLIYNPEILIGEFDKTLACTDTVFYIKLDSVYDFFSFNYESLKTGNDYLTGRLSVPDSIMKEDIYFFKGFYVEEE